MVPPWVPWVPKIFFLHKKEDHLLAQEEDLLFAHEEDLLLVQEEDQTRPDQTRHNKILS